MKDRIKDLLLRAEKPSRYFVEEYNSCPPDTGAAVRFALCFPDAYEVGMSNLGLKLLYHMLNGMEGVSCERCFAPWVDFAALLKENGLPLFSIESFSPLRDFDICGFSLQYEMCYTTVVYMLKLAGIGVFAADRGEDEPLIIAGGPCTVNPAPMDRIFDLFVIGDGEDASAELCRLYMKKKSLGLPKAEFLKEAAEIAGVYAPGYSSGKVKRAVIADLDAAFFPSSPVVSGMELVHDRASLELFRGCTRGCRFCQAGFIYRPVRERSKETLVKYAKQLIDSTGYEELSLSSLSTCDYSSLRELVEEIAPYAKERRVRLALPSLRLDSFEADFVDPSQLASLTFAPEAGSQRLRNVINKNLTDGDILGSVKQAYHSGVSKIKLYYMLGLPTETDEDVAGIAALCRKIKDLYREVKGKGAPSVTVSTSTFIPKPFTPFEREPMAGREDILRRQSYLRAELRRLGVKYNWHDYDTSVMETVLARGDSALNQCIADAAGAGAKLEGWSEFYSLALWREILCRNGLDLQDYLKGKSGDEPQPWDNIDMGISSDYLKAEMEKARAGEVTPDCRGNCLGCGITKLTDCPEAKR